MLSFNNFKNKISKKIDRFFFARLARRLMAKFCYVVKLPCLPYPPEYLQLDICGFCNLSCSICPQGEEGTIQERGMMDFELYKKIIDKAKEAGIFTVILVVSGEPLLHPNFFEMVRYAKATKLKVQSSTNATLLDIEKAKKLIESGLDEIILSFDTVDKELYENYRRGASFQAVLTNIINFLELREKLKSAKPFVVMQNLQPCPDAGGQKLQIEEDFLRTFGKHANLWIMPKYFSDWSGLMKNRKEFSYLENAKQVGKGYRVCEAVYHRLVASWDGKVLACCSDFVRGQVLGDLSRQSIMQAWNSVQFVDLRRKLIHKQYTELPLCRNCGILWPELKI